MMQGSMKRAQLFSQDIIFAFILAIFIFSLWLILRDRVFTIVSASDNTRQLDEAASNALSQLLENTGNPSNWSKMPNINRTTVSSIGLVSDRNVLVSDKVAAFTAMANSGGSNYTMLESFLGLNQPGYSFNLTVSYLNGTTLYSVNNLLTSAFSNASYYAINTTTSIDRFALLNNSLVKVTIGVWIE